MSRPRLRPCQRVEPSEWSPHVVQALCERIPGGRHAGTIPCETCQSVFYPCLCFKPKGSAGGRQGSSHLCAPRVVRLAETRRLNPGAEKLGHLSLVHDDAHMNFNKSRLVITTGATPRVADRKGQAEDTACSKGHVLRRRGADYLFSPDGRPRLRQEVDFDARDLVKLFSGGLDEQYKIRPGARVIKTTSIEFTKEDEAKGHLTLQWMLDAWVVQDVLPDTLAWVNGIRPGHELVRMRAGHRDINLRHPGSMLTVFVARRGALNPGGSHSEDEADEDEINTVGAKFWPCQLVFNMLPAGWTLTPCSQDVSLENSDLNKPPGFEARVLHDGCRAWTDCKDTYTNIPSEMLGSTFFPGSLDVYQKAFKLSHSTLSVRVSGVAYVWAEDMYEVDFPLSDTVAEWTSVGCMSRGNSKVYIFRRDLTMGSCVDVPVFATSSRIVAKSRRPLGVGFQRKESNYTRLHFEQMALETISRKGLCVRHEHFHEAVVDAVATDVKHLIAARANDVKMLVEWGIRSGLSIAQLDFAFHQMALTLSKELHLCNTRSMEFIELLVFKSYRSFETTLEVSTTNMRALETMGAYEKELSHIIESLPIGFLRDLSPTIREAAEQREFDCALPAAECARRLRDALCHKRATVLNEPDLEERIESRQHLTPMGSRGNSRSCSRSASKEANSPGDLDQEALLEEVKHRLSSLETKSFSSLKLISPETQGPARGEFSSKDVLRSLHKALELALAETDVASVNTTMKHRDEDLPDWAIKAIEMATKPQGGKNAKCTLEFDRESISQRRRRLEGAFELTYEDSLSRVDGRLFLGDFEKALMSCGITWFSKEETRAKFNIMDEDESGYLSIDELLHSTRRVKEMVAHFPDYMADVCAENARLRVQDDPREVMFKAFADQLQLGDDLVGRTKRPALPDASISASSFHRTAGGAKDCAPWQSRLDTATSAWVARASDKKPWLQWSFSGPVRVVASITRAHPVLSCWVRWYRLEYSLVDDSHKDSHEAWFAWPKKASSQELLTPGFAMNRAPLPQGYVCVEGNTQQERSSKVQVFPEPMPPARRVRLYPVDWFSESPKLGASLRATLLGYPVGSLRAEDFSGAKVTLSGTERLEEEQLDTKEASSEGGSDEPVARLYSMAYSFAASDVRGC